MSAAFTHHQGKELLVLDFSHLKDVDDGLEAIAEAQKFVANLAAQPGAKLSLLTLTDVTESPFDARVIEALKEFAVHNRPYVRAGAVLGLTPIKRVIHRLVLMFSKRNIASFDTREQALDWLVRQ